MAEDTTKEQTAQEASPKPAEQPDEDAAGEAQPAEAPKADTKPAPAEAAPIEEVKPEPVTAKATAATPAEATTEAEPEAPKAEVPDKFKSLVEEIEKLSVLELSELVKALEGRFGVSAAPVAVAAGVGAAGGEGAAAAEEKSAYTVELTSAGDQKINVIKAVREITGLGLAESKALVDTAPKTIKENVPKAEADEAKSKLEAAGASVELK